MSHNISIMQIEISNSLPVHIPLSSMQLLRENNTVALH
jgi:hypothetical protein